MRLKGKTAIITGAGSGFGTGIAERYALEGAQLVLNDVNAEHGEKVAASIREQGGKCVFIPGDVSNGDDVKAAVELAQSEFGQLDIIVNNAGVSHKNQPLTSITEEEFDRVFRINVKCLFWCAQYAVPAMRAAGGGSIVNIASTAGVRPRPGLTWYNGTKGAMITISKTMAVELAPEKIRVNCVNPVAGETPLLSTFMGEDTPEIRAKFIGSIPMGRFSTPEDIATAALFFATDEAGFITGTCMEVDGGRCV